MTSSDDQRRNKRVRVDPTATTIPDSTSDASSSRPKVPKAKAKAAITAHTETLLPQLSTILQTLGEAHLDLLHRHYTKLHQFCRLEPDTTIIPRSARLDFTLQVPKSIEELPDFITLKDACLSDIESMKQTLRGHVLSALRLEVRFYESSLKGHFATVLRTTTAAILIANGRTDINVHRAVANLLTAHHAALFKHIATDMAEFQPLYTKKHALQHFPLVTAAPPPLNNNTSQSSYFSQALTPAPIVPVLEEIPQLDLIYRTIHCIFISPFDSYLEQHRVNKIELDLKKLVEEDLTATATAAAQLEVEEEVSVSRVLLNEPVQKETKKNTSQLSAEIASLKQMVSVLKDKRGPNPTRGASTKRNASTPTKKTQRKGNAKADAPAADSSKGRKQKANGKKKKNNTKKKAASKTGRTK